MNLSLYEINTIVWLSVLSRKYGKPLTIGSVPVHEWDYLADLGFSYIWLMGVWTRSEIGTTFYRKSSEFNNLYDSLLPGWTEDDIIGSPYSISSYDPDPRIGQWEEIDKVRDALNNRSMGLILDFVPNHTAPDHPWVYSHTDYYIHGTEDDFNRNKDAFYPVDIRGEKVYVAKGRDPYFPPWPDTVQLNYFNAGTRQAMIGELTKISYHCDGVRCDMAMLILNEIFRRIWGWANRNRQHTVQGEFWENARRTVPDLLLIAEAYWDTEWRLQQLGFDYVYDKRLYDRLLASPAQDIRLHLQSDIGYQNKLLRFIENHDESRSAAVFEQGRLESAAVVCATVPGMKLYHQGQLEGEKIKVPLELRKIRDEVTDNKLSSFYKKLLSISRHPVFQAGIWSLKDVNPAGDDSYKNLVAYSWEKDYQLKLIIANFSPVFSQGMITLGDQLKKDQDYLFVDELDSAEYFRKGSEMVTAGLHVMFHGYGAHIFTVEGRSKKES